MLKYYTFISLFLMLTSCAHHKKENLLNPQLPYSIANKYFQHSAESTALYYQAYNMAYAYVEEVMKSYKAKVPACVVLDIDETVLNNSYYQGSLFENKENFTPESWDEWVEQSIATPLPGAMEFLAKIKDLGVQPIFITNRASYLIDATIRNLKKFNIDVSKKFIVGRKEKHSKELRRSRFQNTCNIIQLIGDNLSDLSDDYSADFIDERKNQLSSHHELFGTRYILLPNPMYGDWRKTILNVPLKTIDDLKSR